MSRLRVLYLDVPFENATGGDKNRSRFLWGALRDGFQAELGLIHPDGIPPASTALPGIQPIFQLGARRGPWWESDSIFAFSASDLAAFNQHLTDHPYDAVVTRFHSPWILARAAARHPTRPCVVMDLDMLSSRLVGLTWSQAPSLRNRWFFLEHLKLKHREKALLREPFLVLFSNPEELADVRQRGISREPPCRLSVLPNVLSGAAPVVNPVRQPVILFFGSLNSAANTDAFRHLVDDLLPRLDAPLRKSGVRIHVVGRNPPAWFAERLARCGSDRVVLVGGVDNMDQAIAESRLVLLPLRVASGTRTRLLEAAAQARAVVTTTLGAEGIDVGEDAMVTDDPSQIADAVIRLASDPAAADALGRRFETRCRDRYAASRVAADFTRELTSFVQGRKLSRTASSTRAHE